ncbi:acyl-CoA dehydrogenase family protein [Erythrobacter litoralis]|uniref:Acyl-CoA dehydrogenase family protein n=1 Tax=Erythrobacter litoralis (strain HTCC2594) TaxID=314225 RepID=Q2N8Q2_ERYLH|nr:acyl-CoA dehydrogenase family protein [Erythrobacter litoralis]ABC63939.1 acyl-CoA dehydrogenase family protein [Erythrobacter litoralis HTCC2594]
MDFSFTEEQEMLRDGVGKYLEKNYDFETRQALVRSEEPWSQKAWQQFAEFGLLALPFAEEQGGLGGSISDCVAVAELFGKHLVIEPYAASIMLAGAALAASDDGPAQDWLEKVIAGEAIAAFAYEEGAGTAAPDMVAMIAEPVGDAFTLTGEKRLVVAGGEADCLIVVARRGEDGPLGVFLVEKTAQRMEARSYTTIDGRSAANIRFDATPATLLDGAEAALDRILAHAIIVQSAEAVGAMGALLALTSDYAMTRKQFGVPIGTFQAVAHRLADMKIAYTKARATLLYTTAMAESGAVKPRDIAILKGQVGKLGKAVGEAAIQTHGGVGMTDELSVSHYHKRLLACDAMFGSHDYHLRVVGQG